MTTGIFQALKYAHVAKTDALKSEYDKLIQLVSSDEERSRHKYIAYKDKTNVNQSIIVAPVYEGILNPVVFRDSPKKAIACCRQLIDQVHACAKKGYVHLDIKRENIFVEKIKNDTYNFLLRDFGGVQRVEVEISKGLGFSWSTSVCRHINDKHFSSQAIRSINDQNKSFVLSQDVFSLGLVLYQILQGASITPFLDGYQTLRASKYVQGDSQAYGLLKNVLNPVTKQPVYSRALRRLVAYMLHSDYRQRPTMEQVLERFKALEDHRL